MIASILILAFLLVCIVARPYFDEGYVGEQLYLVMWCTVFTLIDGKFIKTRRRIILFKLKQ